MLKRLLFVIFAFFVFLVVVGLFLPTTYDVERSIVINAPPAAIHPYVNDLQRWSEWEPWSETGDSIQIVRGSVTRGVGASQSWTANSGDGQLTVTASDPGSGIRYTVLFDNQYSSRASVRYTPVTAGNTKVSWSLSGGEDAPRVIGGYFAALMDTMLGPKYEHGLDKLKAAVERRR